MRWIITLCLACWFCSCADHPQVQTPTTVSTSIAKEAYTRSLILRWQGQDSLADINLRKAASLDTNSEFLSAEMMNNFIKRKDDQSAVLWAHKTWKLSQGANASAAAVLGIWSKQSDHLDSAIFYLDTARKLNPRTPLNVLQTLALCQYLKGNKREAILLWKQMAEETNYAESIVQRVLQLCQDQNQDSIALDLLHAAWQSTSSLEYGRLYAQWLNAHNQVDSAASVIGEIAQELSENDSTQNQAKNFWEIQSLALEQQGKISQSLDLRIKALDSNSVEALHRIALLALKAKQPDRAIQWLRLIPQDSLGIADLALFSAIYTDLNQKDSAIIYMNRAQKKAPESIQIRQELWQLMAEDHRHFFRLEQLVNAYFKQNPTDQSSHQLWAQLLWKQYQSLDSANHKDSKLLNRCNEEYVNLNFSSPNNITTLLMWSEILLEQGKIDLAQDKLLQAQKIEPQSPIIQNSLGYFLLTTSKDTAQAHHLIRQALDQDPKNPAIIDSYAWSLHLIGKDPEALELLSGLQDEFSEISLSNWEYFYHISAIHWALGHKDLARTAILNAQKCYPSRPEIRTFIKTHSIK